MFLDLASFLAVFVRCGVEREGTFNTEEEGDGVDPFCKCI